ncbi:hypothetical protein [Kitasatospora sp. NPDC018619]|uniref:hypothetical protein n=1 Tax=unclassified Kitasatospora TaxID=2633591 RepID=UPI00379ACC1E
MPSSPTPPTNARSSSSPTPPAPRPRGSASPWARRTRFSRSLDRLRAVTLPPAAATCWLPALRTGEGGHLPGVLCAIGAGLVAATAAESLRRRPALPPTRGRHPRLRAVTFALPVLPLAVLFCAAGVITLDLP